MYEEEIDFRVEAEGVIKDVSFSVSQMYASKKLPSTRECVYLNIETKESKTFCIQLCIQGFRVVSDRFDHCQDEPDSQFYETIYAQLDAISPSYCQLFSAELSRKLSQLQEEESKSACNS